MTRYSGQPLPENYRIAVIANDAIGNFVVTTPLLQMLRSATPQRRNAATPICEIHYFGGTRTWELQQASTLPDQTFILHGASSREIAQMALDRGGTYDLIFNCESTPLSKTFAGLLASDRGYVAGPCMGKGGRGELPYQDDERGDLWRDKQWIAPDITTKYPFLRSGFIGEMFCRLAYLEGDIPPYEVPSSDPGREVPDVLIATAASLPEKLWPAEKWVETLAWLKHRGITSGLIGAKPSAQKEFWKGESAEEQIVASGHIYDLRGEFALPQVAGALAAAKAVLTLDNGILHMAVAGGRPVVGLFRHGIHRLWAPPYPNLTVLTPGEDRSVAEIEVCTVQEALERVL